MAGITKATAEQRLSDYLNAEEKVLNGQSYTISDGRGSGERRLTRADLAEIRAGIEYWDRQVKRLDRGGGARVRGVRPVGD